MSTAIRDYLLVVVALLGLALGAAIGPASVAEGPARVDRVADEVTYGVLAMDTFVFDGIGTGHAPLSKAA